MLNAFPPRRNLAITDARPDSIDNIRQSTSQIATIGIFILMLGAALYFCRPLLLPVVDKSSHPASITASERYESAGRT